MLNDTLLLELKFELICLKLFINSCFNNESAVGLCSGLNFKINYKNLFKFNGKLVGRGKTYLFLTNYITSSKLNYSPF